MVMSEFEADVSRDLYENWKRLSFAEVAAARLIEIFGPNAGSDFPILAKVEDLKQQVSWVAPSHGATRFLIKREQVFRGGGCVRETKIAADRLHDFAKLIRGRVVNKNFVRDSS